MSKKKTIATIILSLLGGVLYRSGGMGKEKNTKPKWIPMWMRQTKTRDCGVPLLACLLLWIWGLHHWILIPTFFLMFGAQLSYFKKKDTDAKWFNWLFVGLAFSISVLPVSIYVHYWQGFLYRTLIVTVFTTLWSQFIDLDWLEEGGRGIIQIVTLPLILT